ncbi:MAG TPA: acyl-CoA dehydrogenase family protein, partial [Actinophytocola sp.]|uniref:acyl-CoA dehydrogenase family protein n=1 Tax=Actinophytocola sp. TaxID=1872138 RepID=UPI002E07BEB6|nr:acyl-CoA dehydrogenase family protein [Actinophytocola sp.]
MLAEVFAWLLNEPLRAVDQRPHRGHRQPPGNKKAKYQVNDSNPSDPQEWLRTAATHQGTWWTDYVAWLTKRSGEEKLRPSELGGGGPEPLAAPGTYVSASGQGGRYPGAGPGRRGDTMDLTVGIGDALGTDYFFLRDQLTPLQLAYLTRTREFVDQEVLPVINDYWERAEYPWPLVNKLGDLGIVGDGIEGYGRPSMDPLSAGLVHMELSRGDGSLGTFVGVQARLAMRSIAMLGSEQQKQRWLPQMARL